MKWEIARAISELCYRNAKIPGFTLERINGSLPAREFHTWVDGKPSLSIDRVRRDDGLTCFLLIVLWRGNNNWYIVMYPEDRSQPLVEIHKVEHGGRSLNWQYSPRKRDGRNAERISCFKRVFGDTRVRVLVPIDVESTAAFLLKIFDLVVNRIVADNLRDIASQQKEAFSEGIAYERMHTARERNRTVVASAKQRALEVNGCLACEICGFDFAKTYGAHGRNFIEAHHTTPLSHLGGERETRIEDLALVCANCHRMLHYRRPWLGMEDMKEMLSGDAKAPNKALQRTVASGVRRRTPHR
jgi:hypothetical protein